MSAPPKSAPRVAMVIKRLRGRGGLQLQARAVARQLRALGVDCFFLWGSRNDPDADPPPEAEGGVRLVYRRGPQFNLQLVRWLRRHRDRYDVIHVHGLGEESVAAGIAGRLAGRPVVVKPSTAGPGTLLHAWGTLARRCPPAGRLFRFGVKTWIALSEETRADLLRLGAAPGEIALVPNGVDLGRFGPLPSRVDPGGSQAGKPAPPSQAGKPALPSQAGKPALLGVLTVARLLPHKQVDVLLRAFRTASEGVPDAALRIAGRGEEEPRLRQLAAELGIAERVDWLGSVPSADMPEVYAAADVFALLSRSEGLPNALLEAMASGLPPVVAVASGTSDVVRHGEDGFLCHPTDEAAAARALGALLRDADLRARVGAAARERVEACFSLERTARTLIEVYRAALGGRE